ncbi:MAG: hypothetical protein IPH62_15385 [Ignavibacteriae bacterium]|nr:hypothetical protein [Ignavibacteriota bacterium]
MEYKTLLTMLYKEEKQKLAQHLLRANHIQRQIIFNNILNNFKSILKKNPNYILKYNLSERSMIYKSSIKVELTVFTEVTKIAEKYKVAKPFITREMICTYLANIKK